MVLSRNRKNGNGVKDKKKKKFLKMVLDFKHFIKNSVDQKETSNINKLV